MFDDGSPIYRQIAERIRAEVLGGTLAADEQVMSTTQYATHFRINPATAAKAFQQLVDEGVLYKRRGIGMFVSPDAREQLRVEHRGRFFDAVVDPMIAEARAVGVPLEDVIAHVRARMDDHVDVTAGHAPRDGGPTPHPDQPSSDREVER